MKWGSSKIHKREIVKFKTKKICHCGCGTIITHQGTANGLAMMSGCELYVRRWVRDGK